MGSETTGDDLEKAELMNKKSSNQQSSASAAKPSIGKTIFWLLFWFSQNTAITFLNKKAMTPLRLPTTVSSTFESIVVNRN